MNKIRSVFASTALVLGLFSAQAVVADRAVVTGTTMRGALGGRSLLGDDGVHFNYIEGADPTQYGSPDTGNVIYTWRDGVSGPWEYTTNWTSSAATCRGIPDSTKATAVFPASLSAGTEATLTDTAIKVKRLELLNTAPFTLSLHGGAITIESGTSTEANNLEIGKTGPATVEFRGASSQIKTKSPYFWGRIRLGEAYETVLSFELPATPWTSATAPILSSGEDSPIALYSNVCFVVNAAALLAPGEGLAVTNVLAWNGDGVRFYDGEGVSTPEMRAAILARLEVRNAPAGTTGELVYADGAVCFVLRGGQSSGPQPDARVVVDATRQDGRELSNPVSTLTVWDGRWFRRETYPAFLDYIQLFTATGGNEARDLFVDPTDSSTLDDYDFAPLVEQCERVLACHCRPYLKLGNVPLKFCAEPVAGSFRFNMRPPDDGRYAAYDAYIRALVTALKDRFGLEEVRRWRFSVGTESNNKHWFCACGATAAEEKAASKNAFFKLYDHTVKAVTDVLGMNLVIGTHLLGSGASSSMTMFTWNDFIAHCRSGANDATGGTGAPLGLLSVSYYVTAPGRNDAAAGRIADFASVRTALDAAGFTEAVIGMDEGRVDSGKTAGSDGYELVTRAVGQSWQMAFDLRCAKSVFDAGADNFSSWGHFAGPNATFEGVPAMSYFTAREFARFAGLRRLENTVAANLSDGSAVDAISAVSASGDRVRLAVGHFRDQLVYAGEARTEFVVTLPAVMRGRSIPVRTLVLDDSNNWFNDWIADRETYSIPDSAFYFSPDDQSPLMMAEDNPAIAALFKSTLEPSYLATTATLVPCETTVEVPADGVITLPLTLRGNSVAFITVGENEPYAADREPEPAPDPDPPARVDGDRTWTGAAGDGIWETDGNWSPVGAPLANENVSITRNGESLTFTCAATPPVPSSGMKTYTFTSINRGHIATTDGKFSVNSDHATFAFNAVGGDISLGASGNDLTKGVLRAVITDGGSVKINSITTLNAGSVITNINGTLKTNWSIPLTANVSTYIAGTNSLIRPANGGMSIAANHRMTIVADPSRAISNPYFSCTGNGNSAKMTIASGFSPTVDVSAFKNVSGVYTNTFVSFAKDSGSALKVPTASVVGDGAANCTVSFVRQSGKLMYMIITSDNAPLVPPVIGCDGGTALEIADGYFTVSVSNAAQGRHYGYKKTTSLVGVDWDKISTVDLGYVHDSVDADVVLSIPLDPEETSCFFKIVVW